MDCSQIMVKEHFEFEPLHVRCSLIPGRDNYQTPSSVPAERDRGGAGDLPSRNPLPPISTRASAVSSRGTTPSTAAPAKGVVSSTAVPARGVTPTSVKSRDTRPTVTPCDQGQKVGGLDMDDFLPVSI